MVMAMSGLNFDPYCLEPKGVPEPVEGLLPPAIALVDDEEEPLARPSWHRWVALGLLSFLILAVATHARAMLMAGTPRPPATVPLAP